MTSRTLKSVLQILLIGVSGFVSTALAEKTPQEAAKLARSLVHRQPIGTLITTMGEGQWADFPFGSMDYFAPNHHGDPILLISSLQLNAHNLRADNRASLHVRDTYHHSNDSSTSISHPSHSQPYHPYAEQLFISDYPPLHAASNTAMSLPRVTLLGTVEALEDPTEIEEARAIFLATHPDARGWAPEKGGGGFHDFR
ncbi:hypothetical protein HDU93_003745 [Gonapodya sp. JEL0774]|nr:hypothetical protein HDU93_003745 [Gonapodya sp. JEL0774]